MELLRGPDLTEAARARTNRVLEVETALRWFAQIGDALRLIHGRGLLHRDVKAENVRLREADDDPVLLDFGIATALGEAGDFSTRMHRHTTGGGTAGYAPDNAHERRFPDARSDIHALGMTLYASLTGLDPLEDAGVLALRTNKPRQLNPQIPPELESLVMRSIAHDARHRPANMDEWLHDLNAIGHGRTSNVSAPQTATSSTRSDSAIAPFTFRSGTRAHNLEELVAALDRDRSEAKEYLYSGDLAQWLARIGRMDLAQRAREVVEEYPQQKFQGLEAFAQATALVPPPQLEVTPHILDFGVVRERKTVPLNLVNVGRGHLFGILYSPTRGLNFPDKFDGNRQTIPVSFEPRGIARGVHEGEIVLDTSAGVLRLPMRAQVAAFERELGAGSSYDGAVSVVSWGVLGMLAGYLLRALPLSHIENGQGWITSSTRLEWMQVVPLFGLMMLMTTLSLVVAEASRRRSWWVFFGALLPAFGFATLCGLLAQTLLPSGDAALKPLTGVVGNWASGAWMAAGGVVGALYGTLRHARDLWSLKIFEIIGGWTFFLAVLGAIVWLVRWLLSLSSGVPV